MSKVQAPFINSTYSSNNYVYLLDCGQVNYVLSCFKPVATLSCEPSVTLSKLFLKYQQPKIIKSKAVHTQHYFIYLCIKNFFFGTHKPHITEEKKNH